MTNKLCSKLGLIYDSFINLISSIVLYFSRITKRFYNFKIPKEMSISYQMSHFWRLCLLYREMKNCYYEKLSNLTTCHFTLLNSVMVAIYKRDKLHSHDYHVKATYFNFWPCTRVGNIIGPQFVSIARFVSVAKTI